MRKEVLLRECVGNMTMPDAGAPAVSSKKTRRASLSTWKSNRVPHPATTSEMATNISSPNVGRGQPHHHGGKVGGRQPLRRQRHQEMDHGWDARRLLCGGGAHRRRRPRRRASTPHRPVSWCAMGNTPTLCVREVGDRLATPGQHSEPVLIRSQSQEKHLKLPFLIGRSEPVILRSQSQETGR